MDAMAGPKRLTRNRDPQSLASALVDVIGPYSQNRTDPLHQVRLAWQSVCGHEFSRHVRPISLNQPILDVEARNQHWAEAFELLSPKVLNRLSAHFVGLKAIRVSINPHYLDSPEPGDGGTRANWRRIHTTVESKDVEDAVGRLLASATARDTRPS